MTYPSKEYNQAKFNGRLIASMSLPELEALKNRCDAYYAEKQRQRQSPAPQYVEICGAVGWILARRQPSAEIAADTRATIKAAFDGYSAAFNHLRAAGYEAPVLAVHVTGPQTGEEIIADIEAATRILTEVIASPIQGESATVNAALKAAIGVINAKYASPRFAP